MLRYAITANTQKINHKQNQRRSVIAVRSTYINITIHKGARDHPLQLKNSYSYSVMNQHLLKTSQPLLLSVGWVRAEYGVMVDHFIFLKRYFFATTILKSKSSLILIINDEEYLETLITWTMAWVFKFNQWAFRKNQNIRSIKSKYQQTHKAKHFKYWRKL